MTCASDVGANLNSVGPKPSHELAQLHRRHGKGSQVFVRCAIDGDDEALRLQRIRRAFEDKCPKLAAWSLDGRLSVWVLEANDIQLSNFPLVWEAVKQVIGERADIPDIIVFVETDLSPMNGWVFKEGTKGGRRGADTQRGLVLRRRQSPDEAQEADSQRGSRSPRRLTWWADT
jgi:hypothetical protein